jgi:putative aldouronate transport system substrate-binding protein
LNNQKAIAAFMALSLASVSMIGCSADQTKSPAQGVEKPAAAGPVDDGTEKIVINAMAGSFVGGGWPDNNHPTIQELNKRFNIEFKMQWVPGGTLIEKLNVMAASGQLPDIFVVEEDHFVKWQSQDVFVDVKPYLKNYPNLEKAIPTNMMEVLNPKGKLYGFGKFQPPNQLSVVIREDWLKKLGIPMPDPAKFTIDDYYNIAKAFAKDDPDGNGKNDTVGFSAAASQSSIYFDGMEAVEGAFGLFRGWKEVNGKLVPAQTQAKEMKDYLAFVHKAYSEGVMDKDFVTNNGTIVDEKVAAGKVGMDMMHYTIMNRTIAQQQKTVPSAKLVQIAPPIGPSGLRANPTRVSGATKIVLNAKLEPKKIQRILKMLDWWVTEEGTDIIKNGPEGVFYEKAADGKFVQTERGKKEASSIFILNNWFFRNSSMEYDILKWDDPKKAKELVEFQTNNEKYKGPVDAGAGYTLLSPTYAKSSTELNSKYVEAMLKIVVGQQPVDTIDQAIKDWKANGGDKIIEEVNQAYAKNQ